MAYLCIDIGGTKTLVCRVSDAGEIVTRARFETPKTYPEFIQELGRHIAETPLDDIVAVGVGAPGMIDRKNGIGLAFGNEPWLDVPLRTDIENMTKRTVFLENDAKLAGLSESTLLKGKFSRVLYVTISTGIGIGLTVDGRIDTNISDAGGKTMFFEHNDELIPWEDFASGRAIYNEFGQKASEIEDPDIWHEVSRRLVVGFIELIDLTSPEVIVIGGGVGAHYDKFKDIFEAELLKYQSRLLTIPPILQAQRAEDAVVYGCYELAKTQAATAS